MPEFNRANLIKKDGTSIIPVRPGDTFGVANDIWITADDYAGTGVTGMFKVNTDDEIVIGGTLVTGSFEASEDSGAVVLFDMPVSAAPTAGDEESVSIKIDGDTILKCYTEADSSGGIRYKKVHIHDVLHINPSVTPASGSEGDLYVNSADHKLYYHNGTAWQSISV